MRASGQQLESETHFHRALEAAGCQPPPLAAPPPTFRLLSGTDDEQFTALRRHRLRRSWIWQEEPCPHGLLEGAEQEVGSAESRIQPNAVRRGNDIPRLGLGHNSVLHTSAPVPAL